MIARRGARGTRSISRIVVVATGLAALTACGGSATSSAAVVGSIPASTTARLAPAVNPALTVPAGFTLAAIAHVSGARQLVAASNGDLLVGTNGRSIAIVPHAEGPGVAATPRILINLPQGPAQGIALGPNGTLYAATNTGVWKMPYAPGVVSIAAATKIAAVRTGPVAPHSDGDVHDSSSVIVSGKTLYVGVGSSCNACTEVDSTRATVQAMRLDGSAMHTFARQIRNPVAFTVDPATGMVFTGGAGQDDLPQGHPYEFLDALTAHAAGVNYGWPACEENHVAYMAGANCTHTVQPLIVFPAYSTIIGAAYYPAHAKGPYAFPAAFRGGIFVSMHGSWHAVNGIGVDAPHVAFVPMRGDQPAKAVAWTDPRVQWTDFLTGFQTADGGRIGRPTGIAVGSRGSLFVADDLSGTIYRIRPAMHR
jgi:glucose/arabinose dehydrogenase